MTSVQPAVPSEGSVSPVAVHITDVLKTTPEARQWLEEFHQARRKGLLPYASKNKRDYGVGDTLSFRTLNVANGRWSNMDFVFKAESAAANIYVAVTELNNGHVTDFDIAALNTDLNLSTPPNSINPLQGIIANENDVFGDAPNVDGDGVVDVLLYDIIDSIQGGYVGGFVNPADLSPSGPGNRADVVHIDSNEVIQLLGLEGMFSIVAHEYQHLIHFNYDLSEDVFVDEGLSEYASVMNGYEGRPITYLDHPSLRNTSLLGWVGFGDRQRSAVFTTYIAEQTSPFTTGNITKNPSKGIAGYRIVLENAGTTLEDIVVNFHSATLLNSSGLTTDPRFGFSAQTFQGVLLERPDVVVDGRATSETVRRDTVFGGGARYYVWTDVEDFLLTADPVVQGGQTEQLTLGRSRPRVVIERVSMPAEIMDLSPRVTEAMFEGKIERLTLQLAHVKPVSVVALNTSSDRLIYDIDAKWKGGAATIVTTQYEHGTPILYLGTGRQQRFATRFAIAEPEKTKLDEASVAIYYANQFLGGPADTEPRDFVFHVWADSNGVPGAEIFSMEMTDPRPNEDSYSGTPLRFLDIDLSNEDIRDLPGAVHIGASNFGTDVNNIVVGIAAYTVENVSFLSSDAVTWDRLWDVVLTSGESLNNRVAAVRLQTLVEPDVVAVEGDAGLPVEARLEQNYPNPFNPTTTLSYSLPRTAHVKLAVYDILGRHVTTLLNETSPAGRHSLTVDAATWASGLYIYRLEAGGTFDAKRMVLVK